MTPCGFCLKLVCADGIEYKQDPILFTAKDENDDVAKVFVENIEKEVKQFYNHFKFPKKMIFGKTEEEEFIKSENCHLCGGGFLWKVNLKEMDKKILSDSRKVRDHCHFTGKFRGAAHNSCNLLCKAPKFFQLFFIICQDMMHIFLL